MRAELVPSSCAPAPKIRRSRCTQRWGFARSACDFLISDADYVEVLTEIDIQSPIPEILRERRDSLGFVYLGCRFHDQLLRNYASAIAT